MLIKNKKAFTIHELILVFTIIALLSLIAVSSVIKLNPSRDKMYLRKAYMDLKRAVHNISLNTAYYDEDSDFSDTSRITEEYQYETENNINADKVLEGVSKFQGLIAKEMDLSLLSTSTACPVRTSGGIATNQNCYVSDNGTVFGIPATDFKSVNIIEVENANHEMSKYLPITIYPNINVMKKINAYEQYTILVGVRQDGKIILINELNCTKPQLKEAYQCQQADILSNSKSSK